MFLVPIFAATDLRSFESDRRQGLFFSCFQFFLSPKMIKRTILHMYVVWFVIHMYASLEKKGSAMKKVFPGTGSYFHSTARQSRVLTTTPWGQRVLGLNLMRQIRL